MTSRIKVNLSEWYMGEWADKLSSIKVIDNKCEITIEIDPEPIKEGIAKKIIQEAFESFFNDNDGFRVTLESDGVHIVADELSEDVVISWDLISVREGALRALCVDIRENYDNPEDLIREETSPEPQRKP